MNDNLEALRDAVEQLSARVDVLESGAPPRDDAGVGSSTTGDNFWALNGLKDRASGRGEVMLVGTLDVQDGPVEWQEGRDADTILTTEWSDQAAAFAALGHAVRLEILRHILNGTHRTADLAAMDHLGTTGQLHHHLRQLVAAGWVRQRGRGAYEVPVARVVPLLACLVGAGV